MSEAIKYKNYMKNFWFCFHNANNHADIYTENYRYENVDYQMIIDDKFGHITFHEYDNTHRTFIKFNESDIENIKENEKFLGKDYNRIIKLKDGSMICLFYEIYNEK